MTRHRKSFPTDLAAEWRRVNPANDEFGNLIREFEYPAIRERIRSPPVPLHIVLLGLFKALYILAVRFPIYALKHYGALPPNAIAPLRQDLKSDFRDDLDVLVGASTCTGLYACHWVGILGSCLWIELKILGHHVLMGAVLAALYIALVMGFFWLIFFVLAR